MSRSEKCYISQTPIQTFRGFVIDILNKEWKDLGVCVLFALSQPVQGQ